jgi:hypothetical protein
MRRHIPTLGHRIRSALALLLFGLAAHCGSPRSINVEDYSQSCKADADCVPVAAGDVCNSCCPNVAINKADLATYRDERGSIECDFESWGVGYDCGFCDTEAFCNKSRCDLRRVDEYDR